MARNLAWPTSDSRLVMAQIHRKRRLYFACKRLLDVLLAVALLFLLLPLMALLSLLIVLDAPGPAIFKQERVGLRRQTKGRRVTWEIGMFTCYKFRSMYRDSDSETHRAFARAFVRNDQESMAELQNGNTEVRKLVGDPRVTPFGKFLRKSSLDELPQLLNVLKGEMSMVGPRPDVPYSVENYQPWHLERLAAQPGLTGLWQVSGRSRVSFDDWVRMDIEYIRNRSFWLDLKILFLTIPAVLSGRGAE